MLLYMSLIPASFRQVVIHYVFHQIWVHVEPGLHGAMTVHTHVLIYVFTAVLVCGEMVSRWACGKCLLRSRARG